MSDQKTIMHELLNGVKPIKQDKVTPYRKPIRPIPKQRQLDQQRVLEELMASDDETSSFESGDELTFVKNGYSNRLVKRLRRGDFCVQQELDLHGLTVDDARQETHQFLYECADYGVGCARIIHGKGKHSAGRLPVLKNHLLGWLKKNETVIAVCSTPQNDGGTGAVYVLIQKK